MKVELTKSGKNPAVFVDSKFEKGDIVEYGEDVGVVVGYSIGWNPPLVRVEFSKGDRRWITEELLFNEEKVIYT